jgi:excisionase family DNA binding protein
MSFNDSMSHNLMSPDDLAQLLNVPVRTLGQWRYLRQGPPYLKVGRHVRYHPDEVEGWLRTKSHGGPQ